MSVDVTYSAQLTVRETLTDNVPAALAANRLVTHNQFNKTSTINSGSSPAATLVASFEQALVAGVATIDLAALVGTNDIAVVGTGLRVQAIRFVCKAANTAVVSITDGAANGYDGFGTDFFVELPASGNFLIETQGGGAVIGGANKDLDLASTDVDAIVEITILLG